MRYVNVLLLSFLSFNALASSDKADYLFKQFNEKSAECLTLTKRNIDDFQDDYFDSLNGRQKKALLLVLSEKTLSRCSSYEMSEYLTYIITTNNSERIKFIAKLYNKDLQSEMLKDLYRSLNQDEVNRLLNLNTFSSPFDVINLSEKIIHNDDM